MTGFHDWHDEPDLFCGHGAGLHHRSVKRRVSKAGLPFRHIHYHQRKKMRKKGAR